MRSSDPRSDVSSLWSLEPLEQRWMLSAGDILSHTLLADPVTGAVSIQVDFAQGVQEGTFTAQDVLISGPDTQLGSASTSGYAQNVKVVGDTAYVLYNYVKPSSYNAARTVSGVAVFDVSDPANPGILADHALEDDQGDPAHCTSLDVSGSMVYVSSFSGLYALDVSDPANIQEYLWTDEPFSYDVQAKGDWVFLASSDSSVFALDFSDPDNVVVKTRYISNDGVNRLALDAQTDTLFAATPTQKIYAVDVSNPANMDRLSGSYNASSWSQYSIGRMTAENGYLYVLEYRLGVLEYTLDSSSVSFSLQNDPDASYISSGALSRPRVSGENLVIPTGTGDLKIYDISDKTNPVEETTVDVTADAGGVWMEGDMAYVAAEEAGLQILNLASAGSPGQLNALQHDLRIDAIAREGSLTFLAGSGFVPGTTDRWGSLLIYDMNNPQEPVLLGELSFGTGSRNTGQRIQDVQVSGNVAILRGSYGLHFVDVSDPTAPQLLSTVAQPPSGDPSLGVQDLQIEGSIVYATWWNQGLVSVDFSDPQNPVVMDQLVLSGAYGAVTASNLELVGDRAYVTANGGGLFVVDISDPSDLDLLGSRSTFGALGWFGDLAIQGDYAFVSEGGYGLRVLNISNPANISLVTSLTDRNYAIAVDNIVLDNGTLYVGLDDAGMSVIDVENPAALREIGYIPTRAEYQNMYFDGKLAFLPSGSAGLEVLALHPAGVRRIDADSYEILPGLPMGETVVQFQIGDRIEYSAGGTVSQPYSLVVSGLFAPLPGDVNGNGRIAGDDVDTLRAEIAKPVDQQDLSMDLTGDGLVDSSDLDALIQSLVVIDGDFNLRGSQWGDFNFDGTVDDADAALILNRYRLTWTGYAGADLTGDHLTGLADIRALAATFGYTRPATAPMPEADPVQLPEKDAFSSAATSPAAVQSGTQTVGVLMAADAEDNLARQEPSPDDPSQADGSLLVWAPVLAEPAPEDSSQQAPTAPPSPATPLTQTIDWGKGLTELADLLGELEPEALPEL